MSDKEIFNGLKAGDRRVIKGIYKEVLPAVQRYIESNSGSSSDAHDIFQETMETILLKIEKCPTNFKGLVMTIAKRRWIDKLRRSGKEAIIVEEISRDSVEEEASNNYDKYQLMEKTFYQLSELCQKLIEGVKSGLRVEQLVRELDFSNANTLYRRKAACIERWSNLVKQQKEFQELFD